MISLRCSLISKLCAGLFVALIAMPFTAPFRAWDSGPPIAKPSSNDLKASDELSNNTAIAAATAPVVPMACNVIVLCRTVAKRTAQPHTLQPVLRV